MGKGAHVLTVPLHAPSHYNVAHDNAPTPAYLPTPCLSLLFGHPHSGARPVQRGVRRQRGVQHTPMPACRLTPCYLPPEPL